MPKSSIPDSCTSYISLSLFLFNFIFNSPFPFSHSGFLFINGICFQATIGGNGRPSNRTVVFRGFEEGTDGIHIYTDSRSRKVLLRRSSIFRFRSLNSYAHFLLFYGFRRNHYLGFWIFCIFCIFNYVIHMFGYNKISYKICSVLGICLRWIRSGL